MAASSSKSTTAFIDSVAELPEITSGFGRRGEKRKEKDHSAERERGAKEPSVRVDHQTEVGERRGLGGAAPLCAAFVQEPGIEEGPAHPCNTNISPVAPSSAVQQIAGQHLEPNNARMRLPALESSDMGAYWRVDVGSPQVFWGMWVFNLWTTARSAARLRCSTSL